MPLAAVRYQYAAASSLAAGSAFSTASVMSASDVAVRFRPASERSLWWREVIGCADDGEGRTTLWRCQRFDWLLQAPAGPGFGKANHSVEPCGAFEVAGCCRFERQHPAHTKASGNNSPTSSCFCSEFGSSAKFGIVKIGHGTKALIDREVFMTGEWFRCAHHPPVVGSELRAHVVE